MRQPGRNGTVLFLPALLISVFTKLAYEIELRLYNEEPYILNPSHCIWVPPRDSGWFGMKAVVRRNYYMLSRTATHSAYPEVSFISNPEEEKCLKDEAYLNEIAEGIFAGIIKSLANSE